MDTWYLPTLSEIIALSEQQLSGQFFAETPKGTENAQAQREAKAEQQWYVAIAGLNALLQQSLATRSASRNCAPELALDIDVNIDVDISRKPHGVVLSGPTPILARLDLMDSFTGWTFSADPNASVTHRATCQLLPSADARVVDMTMRAPLPLLADDPLSRERFCLVLTPAFCLVMSLGEDTEGRPVFLFSFTPSVVWQAWRSLQSRVLMTQPHRVEAMEALMRQFPPVEPAYQTVMQFSRCLLTHLPDLAEQPPRRSVKVARRRRGDVRPDMAIATAKDSRSNLNPFHRTKVRPVTWREVAIESVRSPKTLPLMDVEQLDPELNWPDDDLEAPTATSDVELLQAIAHEIRTPLTTIRTMTRSLLRRTDLDPQVMKRLRRIDQECTEQIDRFNLIFRAVELKTTPTTQTPLATISLNQLLEQNIPRWQNQAQQHNLTLEVIQPQTLPMVVSDPVMLDQVLTGLMDHITHSLTSGSHIQLHVALAGHQLKLQFQSRSHSSESPWDNDDRGQSFFTPTLKSLGELLIFQPETGNLGLNLAVTKTLFQALGGKLTVRYRPQQGEILTIFLPLDHRWVDDSQRLDG